MENPGSSGDNSPSSFYNVHDEPFSFDQALLPNLVVRIKAAFIDLSILLTTFAVASFFTDIMSNIPTVVKGAVAVFMFFLYDPMLTAFTGGTIGHKLMKLRIKRFSDSRRNISFLSATIRFLIKGILGWVSFFTVTGNSNKRAIHDIASGSITLKKRL
jgi:uncharacterized RDD family membrane protein YckC